MSLRAEFRPMLALAGPIVLAEIGWVSMGLVDTIVVGPLGPAAIGAVGIGSILFQALAVFGMGLLLGLDTLVSHAYGAGHIEECHRWLMQGIWLSVVVAPVLTAVAWIGVAFLPAWGFAPDVLRLLQPYLGVVTWSLLPLLFYAAFRRYLQAVGIVRPVTFALVSANLINAVAAWALVYGHLGAPVMGTTGSALATLCSRVYLAVFLVATVARSPGRLAPHDSEGPSLAPQARSLAPHGEARPRTHWRPDRRRLSRLARLGIPAAGQVTLELGVFAAASALAGRLDAVSLASHQITLNLASFTFMVPLGLASAGAVRVGHAVGRRDAAGAARSGTTALILGASFMASAGLAFILVPRLLVGVFTSNERVLALTSRVLLVAGVVQLFDGLQGVSTGILRGLGDTRTTMFAHLAGLWVLGLPLGYTLCFWRGWGVLGLWVGLSSGLFAVAITLVAVWRRRLAVLSWPS